METFLVFTKERVGAFSQHRRSIPCLGTTKMEWVERDSIQAESHFDAVCKAKQCYVMMKVKIVAQSDYLSALNSEGQVDWLKLMAVRSDNTTKPDTEPVKTSTVVTPIVKEYKGIAKGIKVSSHALKRYRERSGRVDIHDNEIKNILLEWLDRSREVELVKHYGVIALLNHGLRPARYYRWDGNGGWTFVISDGEIETIHRGEAGHRWKPISVGRP